MRSGHPKSLAPSIAPASAGVNADARLQKVFGKPQVTMFELAGLIGKHLS